MRTGKPTDIFSGSKTADGTSSWMSIAHFKGCAIQININSASTGIGSFIVQGTNDPGVDGSFIDSTSTLQPVDLTSSYAISGTTGSPFMINVDGAYYRWVRLKYTHTSGTTVIDATYFNGKGES